MTRIDLLSNPMTTAEDIIVGGASGVPERLAAGSEGDVLTIDSGVVAWAAPAGGATATALQTLTGALTTAEGAIGYDTDDDFVKVYDGQRDRAVSHVGWTPTAYPLVFDQEAPLSTSMTLAANGGSLAVPMVVPSHMLFEQVELRSNDTGTARAWRWDLYLNKLNNGNSGENTVDRLAAPSAAESFTPSAASNRFLSASAVTYLAPGLYWLVIQCTHATNNFAVGTTAVTGGGLQAANISGQTKTTSNPNGGTLDLVAATWSKQTAIIGVAMRGRALGLTAPM